jgi:hypothetical protein
VANTSGKRHGGGRVASLPPGAEGGGAGVAPASGRDGREAACRGVVGAAAEAGAPASAATGGAGAAAAGGGVGNGSGGLGCEGGASGGGGGGGGQRQ